MTRRCGDSQELPPYFSREKNLVKFNYAFWNQRFIFVQLSFSYIKKYHFFFVIHDFTKRIMFFPFSDNSVEKPNFYWQFLHLIQSLIEVRTRCSCQMRATMRLRIHEVRHLGPKQMPIFQAAPGVGEGSGAGVVGDHVTVVAVAVLAVGTGGAVAGVDALAGQPEQLVVRERDVGVEVGVGGVAVEGGDGGHDSILFA